MAYTRHGHQIPYSEVEVPRPNSVVRCGGTELCRECRIDAGAWALRHRPVLNSRKEPQMDNPTKAREIAYNYIKEHLEKTDTHVTFGPDEVYIVWFCYILGGWKALISTTLPDGMYYELTYNKASRETYLDAYKKFHNVAIPDKEG